jgi:hypothetical protein
VPGRVGHGTGSRTCARGLFSEGSVTHGGGPSRDGSLHRCDAGHRAKSSVVRPARRRETVYARGLGDEAAAPPRTRALRSSLRPSGRAALDAATAGIGARGRALGSVTLHVLSVLVFLAVTRGSVRAGSLARSRTSGEMKAPRAHPKPETVHADWWRRPWLSGTTRGSSKGDPRADAGGRICDLPGTPAKRRGVRGTPVRGDGEEHAPHVRAGPPKRAARRVPRAPAPRGEMRCGVCRDEGQSFFEKRIVSCRRRSNGPGSSAGRAPREHAGSADADRLFGGGRPSSSDTLRG